MSRFYFLTLLFWYLPLSGIAQQFQFQLHPDSLSKSKYLHLPEDGFLDQMSFQNHIKQKIDSLQKQGFFAASIDSTKVIEDKFHVYAFLGNQYQIKEISNSNIDESIFSLYFADQEAVNWAAVSKKKKKIVAHYVDQGFINAEIQLQGIQFEQDKISAQLHINKGAQYTLDSISIIGDLEIRQNYLLSRLEIEKGEVLNAAFFKKLNEQIRRSRFMEMKEEPSFQLQPGGKTIVYLPVNEKAANEFDLLIGFLPNPNPRLSNNNILITGEGRLQLYNPLGAGREFFVDYKQLQPESPRLQANLFFPHFLQTDFGVIGSFDLFKQDTSFINIDGSFGVRYDFKGNKNLSLLYHRARSFLQEVDTNLVKETRALPPSVDFNQNIYTAKFNWMNTNQLRNPSKGFNVSLTAGVGNRTITRNENITSLSSPDFDFEALYNGINDNKLLALGEFKGQYFIPLFSRSTFLLQNQTNIKEVNRFFDNDLYRIGGHKSIRGFDELSYLASAYSTTTGEYRLLLNQDSFFSVFADWAYLDNRITEQDNQLLGIGSGLDLATRAGIFSVNLAVGQDNNTNFDFNKTRIHIGYVNVF